MQHSESRSEGAIHALSRAAIEALESNAVVLKLPDAWSADALRDHAQLIEEAIADVLGVPLKVRLRVDGARAPEVPRRETSPR